MVHPSKNKVVVSWALYDWANSAFSTLVIAGFFPVLFKQYWGPTADVTLSSFRLGTVNSLSSLIVALLAPLLGAIADQAGARKRFLLLFAILGIAMTTSLPLVAAGHWALAVALYMLALIGFSTGNIFYDALLPYVAGDQDVDLVSALGYALGYLGGGLLFAVSVLMTLYPQYFGLADASEAMRLAFILVGAWWALFSIPLFLFVEEPQGSNAATKQGALGAGLDQLRTTFRDIRQLRVVAIFLLGYWMYMDGVDTIVRMAVDYGLSLGFGANSLIMALLITQLVGFPAALAFGRIGKRMGAKTGIFIGLGVYLGVCGWAFVMDSVTDFYLLAVAIGLVQGGVQSLSRSLYTQLIPTDKTAEFFGFYNMLGKFAAIIGPLLMGWIGVVTGNPRHAVLSLALLFVGGAITLYFVDIQEGRRCARKLEQARSDAEQHRPSDRHPGAGTGGGKHG
ncbi:MFS transporter [Thiohalobacter sp. IOR34]|uniref:MFS transporter n=1 Tax=Thiohalobacter sp. IOR34 TaxID=3057176 RepID=UPI0025B14299|nr:MFS transporter [Thiohalobacter sp. IOR34]WJW76407.1 MFS transporter [Thiohalobacter sp. IOR34]